MFSTKVTDKGQLMLPEEIREHLKLVSGGRVEFVIEEDGQVKIVAQKMQPIAIKSKKSLRGCLKRYAKPDLIDQEQEVWQKVVGEKYGSC
jgi:AbrB family looped-hinge helix DNA binding protein